MDFPTSLQKVARTPSSRLIMNMCVIYFLHMFPGQNYYSLWMIICQAAGPLFLGTQIQGIPSAEFLADSHLPQTDTFFLSGQCHWYSPALTETLSASWPWCWWSVYLFFFFQASFWFRNVSPREPSGPDFQSNSHSYLGSDNSINAASYFPVFDF